MIRHIFIAGVAVVAAASSSAAQQTVAYPTDPRPSVAAGKLTVHVLFDSAYKRPRRIWIYTPPGYDARRAAAYPMIVAFDGDEYRDTMPLPFILDTLLAAGKAPAFVAVLIDNDESGVRIDDLGNATKMVTFLGRQLMPHVRARWRVTPIPAG